MCAPYDKPMGGLLQGFDRLSPRFLVAREGERLEAVVLRVANDSVLVDQEGVADGRAQPLVECAVCARDSAVRPEVADEAVDVVLLRLPRAQAVHGITRDPDDLGVLQPFEV